MHNTVNRTWKREKDFGLYNMTVICGRDCYFFFLEKECYWFILGTRLVHQ